MHINRREVYSIFTIRPSVHPDPPASPLRFADGKAGLFLCTRAEWLKFVLIELQSYFVSFHIFEVKSAKAIDFLSNSVYSEHRKPNGFSHKAYEAHKAKDITGGLML